MRKRLYDLQGGPYHGKSIRLYTPSTAVFRVGNSVGRYVVAYSLPTRELRAHAAFLDTQWREKRRLAWYREARQLHWQSM